MWFSGNLSPGYLFFRFPKPQTIHKFHLCQSKTLKVFEKFLPNNVSLSHSPFHPDIFACKRLSQRVTGLVQSLFSATALILGPH